MRFTAWCRVSIWFFSLAGLSGCTNEGSPTDAPVSSAFVATATPSATVLPSAIPSVVLDAGLAEVCGKRVKRDVAELYCESDADLRYVAGLTDLEVLNTGIKVTDAGLRHVAGLAKLTQLHLEHTKVTNAGLMHVAGLTSLRELGLGFTKVTDAGLVHVVGLEKLTQLNLEHSNVTDAGLVHLVGLTSLAKLDLTDTHVTDAGLMRLAGLTKLTMLRLYDTDKVTRAGVTKLQKALPHCIIESERPPL